MADLSYPLGGQGVYEKQGGKELIVGSTGLITVESGGVVVVDAGAKTTIPVTSNTTAMSNFGLTTITGETTAVGSKTFVLAAPDRVGLVKSIVCTTANTSDSCLVDLAPASLLGWGTQDIIKFSTGGDSVQLISTSTAQWAFIARTPTTVTTTS
jgi:hypothetical protein